MAQILNNDGDPIRITRGAKTADTGPKPKAAKVKKSKRRKAVGDRQRVLQAMLNDGDPVVREYAREQLDSHKPGDGGAVVGKAGGAGGTCRRSGVEAFVLRAASNGDPDAIAYARTLRLW